MNPTPYQDDERHEALSMSPAEKADGFAAVMKRLKGRSGQERAQLRAQADAAILGHEAYALSHDNLRRGNYVAAKRWLRVAADHSVPGAEQALEEIETGPADDLARPITVKVTADAAPCPTGATHAGTHEFEKWASLLQNWTEAGLAVDAARAQARQIIEQARRTADEVLAKAHEDADRARADARDKMAAEHRVAAELLHEAERLQQDARLLVRKGLRAAEPVIDERPSAQVLKGEAQQRARAFAADLSCRTDGLQREQRQQTPRPVKTSRTARTLVTSTDVDAGTPWAACIDEFQAADTWWAWLHSLVEAYSRARTNLPERSAAYRAGLMRRHSEAMTPAALAHVWPPVLHSGSVRLVTEVRPVDDIDCVFEMHGVVRLGQERHTADGSVSSGSPEDIARWITSGNEVASATLNAEQQRGEACLAIFWVTDACEEAVDENGAASDIVSVEEAAHVAPR
ncbi:MULTISPECIES: hypothetical protein [Streptomyces]|uniref:hypothetical protein n=1 Tax=Streptomyces TaxID=1883 RepID=UPI0029A95A96|nr:MULTISPECIES: hypothetical protein [Streptomyces]MDX3067763.1 hypothetical protein [Streptomyces sp. ND04-05B]MDX3519400.1 hypothetical protein [Streptomyces scabiei]